MDGPPFLPKNFLLSPSAQPPTHTPAKPRRKYLFAHSLVKRWDPLPIQDLRLKKYFRTNCLLLLFRSTLFYNCWDLRENILLILSFLSSRYVLALMSPPHGQGRARPLGKEGGGGNGLWSNRRGKEVALVRLVLFHSCKKSNVGGLAQCLSIMIRDGIILTLRY